MAADLALVSESNPELRDGQLKMLLGIGFHPLWTPTPIQLEQQLLSSGASTAASLLLVIDVLLAKACVNAIEQTASQRRNLRLFPITVVLAYEPDTLTTVCRPALSSCEVLEVAEKPISLGGLRAVAVRSRLESRRWDLRVDPK